MRNILIPLLSLALFCGCQPPKEEQEVVRASVEVYKTENQPTETLNIGILAINGVYNSELMAPYDIFQHTIFHTEKGMKVFIVSPTEEAIKTFEGIRILPDYDFENVPEIDVLVVPSAEHNMDTDLEDETLINFVKEKGEAAKFIMSLCDGAFILAQAGLLDGLRCTTFPSDIDRFKETFPHLDVRRDISFVHDGKAITSAGGAKSYDPALYLVEYLYGKKAAVGVGKGLVIDWKLEEIEFVIPQ
ncbi:MAG: DJ-1/PfpI family protein [Roseivirga sp.]|nr:DJ-1/PfpI family protein [Roseivirga sp.]